MAAVDPHGNETYWINGISYQGVRYEPSKVGGENYWCEGLSEENLTPLQNFDTGKQFLLFE